MKRLFGIVVAALLTSAAASAQDAENQLEAIVERAIADNPSLSALRDSIAELRLERPRALTLEQTKLSLSGSYSVKPTGDVFGGGASLSLPVVSQLSLGASYDFVKESASLSLSVQPFAKGGDADAWLDQLTAKELSYKQEEAKLRSSAESFYVAMAAALAKLEIAKARFDIAEASYKGAVLKYEAGLLSYKEYRSKVQEYQSSLQDVLKAERELLSQRKNALTIFGGVAVLDKAETWKVSADQLIAAAEELETSLSAAGAPDSLDLIQARMDLAALEREQKATLVWQPNVSMSAKSNTPFDSAELSVSLSISLDQLKLDEKTKLASDIELKRLEVERKRLELEYSLKQQLIQCETLKESLDINRAGLRLTEEAYEEAKVQNAAGTLDKADLETARLDLEEAALAFTQAAAEYLASWRALRLYYLKSYDIGGKAL